QENYERDRDNYVKAKMADLRQDYDRRNAARHQANLLSVVNELTVLRDQVTEASYARLNDHMRRQAGSHLDASISLIVQKLTPILEKFVEDQEEAYRQAAEDVEKYLSDHRNED